MADTRVQVEAEDWVRREWLPQKLGFACFRERVKLRSGGVFDFDAVNAEHTVAMTISTSTCRTSGGKNGVGKMMKLRSDMLFLLLAQVQRRGVVLTDRGMYEQCLKERAGGRVPDEIEFFHAELPPELQTKLLAAQAIASREVRPGQAAAVAADS